MKSQEKVDESVPTSPNVKRRRGGRRVLEGEMDKRKQSAVTSIQVWRSIDYLTLKELKTNRGKSLKTGGL